jgi:peroxiredoxin
MWSRVEEVGASLLLCSVDSPYTLAVFQASVGGLPFPLGSDLTRTVSRTYQVLREAQGFATRAMFVIDGDGVVRYENRQFPPGERAAYDAVLEAAAQLSPGASAAAPR